MGLNSGLLDHWWKLILIFIIFAIFPLYLKSFLLLFFGCLQISMLKTEAQIWVQYFIWGLTRVSYIFQTTFAAFEKLFLTIQPIIPFAFITINKIWLTALNLTSKSTPKLHSTLHFWFPCCLIYIQLKCFWIQYLVLHVFLYQIFISKYHPNMTIYFNQSVLFLLMMV